MRCLLWLSLASIVFAAAPSSLQTLADSIPGAVPAEFAADMLIRVADAPAALHEGSAWRADLYERAFDLAKAAQDPFPTYLRRDPRARSRINPIDSGSRLDTLSLEVRAFNGLIELRRERALEIASAIDVRVPRLICGDRLIPNPAGAFEIARQSSDVLSRQVADVRSSTQLAAAFEAILDANLPSADSRKLLVDLTVNMRSLDDDDVSFSDTLGPTWAAVQHVMDSAGNGSVSDFVLDAFRMYLVRHLTAPRCASQAVPPGSPSAEGDILAEIDDVLLARDRPRLTLNERTAVRIVDNAPSPGSGGVYFGDIGLWRSRTSRNLITQANALRVHVQSGRPVDDRRTTEWAARLSQFYAMMSAWNRTEEPTLETYLRERGILLEMLVDVIPSGDERIRALGDLVAFLKSDGRLVYGNNMWFSRLRALIDTCRNSSSEWDWLLPTLLDSGDPVIRLYAQIEQLSAAQ